MAVRIVGEDYDVAHQHPLFGVSWGDIDGTISYEADNAVIYAHYQDRRGNQCVKSIDLYQAIERVQGLNDLLGNTPRAEKAFYVSEIENLTKFIEDMAYRILPKAFNQGPLENPYETRRRVKSIIRRHMTTVPKEVFSEVW